jgi:hypothetical protein
MALFSPELCVNLFKYSLRYITVQNMEIENVQCVGARYLLHNPYLHSLCNSDSQNVVL